MTKKNFYYPELDGLRFFAFLLVFIHHTPIFTSLSFHHVLHKYGWVGVDLFLCLSAFLFTRLLFMEHEQQGDINIKNFYIRRALRIWPLYFAFLGFTFFITFSYFGWKPQLLWRALGMMLFAENIFAAYLRYNTFFHSIHLWTISYEEQFYAVIPWTLRKMFKMNRGGKMLTLGLIFFLFSAIRAYLIYIRAPQPAIWVLPVTHFESILGGLVVGLGLFDDQIKKVAPWIWMAAGLLCLGVVSTLPSTDVITWLLMYTYPLVGLGTSLILISVLSEKQWAVKSMVRHPWLAYLGKISYGLYVYHVFALNYVKKLMFIWDVAPATESTYRLFTFIFGLLLTILISSISYYLLEKPFLRLKERFSSIPSRPI